VELRGGTVPYRLMYEEAKQYLGSQHPLLHGRGLLFPANYSALPIPMAPVDYRATCILLGRPDRRPLSGIGPTGLGLAWLGASTWNVRTTRLSVTH
jgi:hypothetical protein